MAKIQDTDHSSKGATSFVMYDLFPQGVKGNESGQWLNMLTADYIVVANTSDKFKGTVIIGGSNNTENPPDDDGFEIAEVPLGSVVELSVYKGDKPIPKYIKVYVKGYKSGEPSITMKVRKFV